MAKKEILVDGVRYDLKQWKESQGIADETPAKEETPVVKVTKKKVAKKKVVKKAADDNSLI